MNTCPRACPDCNEPKPRKKFYHSYCVDCQVIRGLWGNINSRCSDPHSTGYENYGARGIKVCVEWSQSFAAFRTWVISNLGYRPEGHTFDRIDTDGNYEPGNVKWSKRHEQMRNVRHNVLSFEKVKELRTLYASGEWTQMRLAHKYDISQGHVSSIVNNQKWTD